MVAAVTNKYTTGSVVVLVSCLFLAPLQAADQPPQSEPAAAQAQLDPCPQGPVSEGRPRRRPGYPVLSFEPAECDPSKVPPPQIYLLKELPPVPDRWRIVDTLGYKQDIFDPYSSNNPLKADKPVFGEDWFFNLSIISDTVVEPRKIPTPVGAASTLRSGSLDLIGEGEQTFFNQNFIIETVLYQGDTVFRPPDYEFRFTPVINFNYTNVDEIGVVKADPSRGDTRSESHIGVQGLFIDKHLRNVSDRYDFDSIRVGIQPMSSDFRGFLFQDNQLGIRLFGNRDNNIYQYNLAWFRRLEKDTNSGLNDVTESLRDDDVFIANLYRQDFPRLGFISQLSIIYNRNREKNDIQYDDNQFLTRPASLGTERGREYDVVYLGYNGDGHIGRLNLTASAYLAWGDESNGTFTNQGTDIRAYFLAAEASRDFDWVRVRGSFLHASGDDDPFDSDATGFDAIFENPQFAGGETSFWIRQGIPLIGGGKVALSGRNAVLPSLRSSKEQGQSNFANPGLTLLGIGADFDLSPQTRVSLNLNQLWFDDTAVLELARNQGDVDRNIGQDLSVALIWRPFATQNVVTRLSGAVLIPGQGFEDLYGNESLYYSVLGNLILVY